MDYKFALNIILLFIINSGADNFSDNDQPPEGYYAFIESPSSTPPKVKLPPYTPINKDCIDFLNKRPYVSANNLCGDLNKGKIPRNPMGQNVFGEIYPFELIKNQTLKFLSKTLPILKVDDTLPKVTQVSENEIVDGPHKRTNDEEDSYQDYDGSYEPQAQAKSRSKRAVPDPRKPRKFCDGGGIFCALYRAVSGEPISSQLIAERRDESIPLPPPRYEGPPTPCPAKVEYVTPVFAKNYQGSWRYVVQIPYEGYFTQTVEVTRCLQTKCHYLDGGCLSSPRWVSLLVAEIFYPNTEEYPTVSSTTPIPQPQDFQKYQEYLQKRAGIAQSSNETYYEQQQKAAKKKQQQICDGVDEIGCFQIRLYYDWFLIPGSCKCWRPDYFAKYVKKRPITPEL